MRYNCGNNWLLKSQPDELNMRLTINLNLSSRGCYVIRCLLLDMV